MTTFPGFLVSIGTMDEWTVVRALYKEFDGDVFLPGEEQYEAERLSWRRRVDPRPALIAEAACARDVRAAILTAREYELPFAVQATGHGTLAPADDGLLLKTSPMATVEVDPDGRTARVGPGAVWSTVVTAAARHGLAPLSGTGSVGVAGYALGGGAGWLSRTYGFAADSLLGVEVVTVDGRILAASPEEHPDLFWALCGGGGAFGVVTELELRLYPVERVCAGTSLLDGTLMCCRDTRALCLDDPACLEPLLKVDGFRTVSFVETISIADPSWQHIDFWAAGG